MKLGPASRRYAQLLQILSITGMVLLLATFVIYIFEIVPPRISPERVSQLWHLSADEFNEQIGNEPGWNWIRTIATGDGLAFASIVYLALGTIVCMVLLVPVYVKQKRMIYLGIVIAEAAVLTLAASGLLVA